jgi:hypothetical protein
MQEPLAGCVHAQAVMVRTTILVDAFALDVAIHCTVTVNGESEVPDGIAKELVTAVPAAE